MPFASARTNSGGSEAVPAVPPPCITDTFTRTEAGGWGISDAFIPWDTFNDGTGGATYVHSVDGSRALMSVSAEGGNVYSDLNLDSCLSLSLRVDLALTANMTDGVGQWGVAVTSAGPRFFGFAHNSALGAETYLYLSHLYPNTNVANERVIFPLVSGAWYSLRMERQEGVEQRVRVWALGDAEPTAWTLTDSLVGVTSTATTYIDIDLNSSSIDDGTVVLELDNLDILGVYGC